MKIFTVIGVYDNDGQVFAATVTDEDAHAAMRQVAAEAGVADSDLQILGAIEGHHEIVPACEDSGKSAHASDLTAPEFPCPVHPDREATRALNIPCAPGGKFWVCPECFAAEPGSELRKKCFEAYQKSHETNIQEQKGREQIRRHGRN